MTRVRGIPPRPVKARSGGYPIPTDLKDGDRLILESGAVWIVGVQSSWDRHPEDKEPNFPYDDDADRVFACEEGTNRQQDRGFCLHVPSFAEWVVRRWERVNS